MLGNSYTSILANTGFGLCVGGLLKRLNNCSNISILNVSLLKKNSVWEKLFFVFIIIKLQSCSGIF